MILCICYILKYFGNGIAGYIKSCQACNHKNLHLHKAFLLSLSYTGGSKLIQLRVLDIFRL